VRLRPLVSKHSLAQAVEHSDRKSGLVARLVDLFECDVVADRLDTVGPPERLLAGSAVFAYVCEDVHAEFSDVETALRCRVPDDIEQGLNDAKLLHVFLEVVEGR